MDAFWAAVTRPEQAAVAVGVLARIATATAVGAIPITAATSLPTRAACVLGLAVAAWPVASQATVSADPAAIAGVAVGEAVVGLGLGLAVAAVLSAAAWAGTLLGSVSGLSWADDFTPDGDQQTAGISRLAWWLGLMGFLATGGHLALVAGLVDTFRTLPVGAGAAGGGFAALLPPVVEAASTAVSLAVMLAGPALAAVLAFHVAAAVAVRVGRVDPGQGLLQSLASLVLVAAVCLAADSWIGGYAAIVQAPVTRCLDLARP